MNTKILIIGAFGYSKNVINGATIKTRMLRDGLSNALYSKIDIIDTSIQLRSLLLLFQKILQGFRGHEKIIILPGYNGLRMLTVIYIFLKIHYNVKVHYIVIGGWLPGYLQKNIIIRKLLFKIDSIHVETKYIKEPLIGLGYQNVYLMPNFRNIDKNFTINFSTPVDPIKIVFLSRVEKTKGVKTAIKAITEINSNYGTHKFMLDIYGPISNNFREEFEYLLHRSDSNISYCGVLTKGTNEVLKTLVDYDFMIFPSFYEGEGFAGVIIEAFCVGLPIIASDWKSNPELILHNTTGFIYKTEDLDKLVDTFRYIKDNTHLIPEMKRNCIENAKYYHSDYVIKSFLKSITGSV